ncbi:uncharacterized protein KGF55_003117 [Candida pseudojiufengensis]|uniref:uncharacterized protein n=1 Tax=Candida pseudojiufengensis TaxID=497109 RepID=UPI002224596B|nr:uncharacterized protein KGF55_003117 [Candida pseudojiufengensis]KAI5963325.1 hypothetical protein KGF55_003117 [Candida pseudojiufengensis]
MDNIRTELFEIYLNAALVENNDNSNKIQVQSGKTSSIPIVSNDLENQVQIDQNSSVSASGDLKDLAQSVQISSTLFESRPLLSKNNRNQPNFWSWLINRWFIFDLDYLFPPEEFDNYQYVQELKSKYKLLGKESLYWTFFVAISVIAACISFNIILGWGALSLYVEGCKK